MFFTIRKQINKNLTIKPIKPKQQTTTKQMKDKSFPVILRFSILEKWLKRKRSQLGRYKGSLNNLVNVMESFPGTTLASQTQDYTTCRLDISSLPNFMVTHITHMLSLC